MSDKIIEEVRKIRDDYARQFNYDLHAMCEDLRHEQELNSAVIVSFPRRLAQIVTREKGDTTKRGTSNR